MLNKFKLTLITQGDNYMGSLSAPIKLLQYGDYECKHSGAAFIIVKNLIEILGDQLLYAFRHYPLATLHPLSLEAAIASEAAALEGKFWEMHNTIYEHQSYLVKSSFLWYAEELGLNMRAFYDSREYKKLMDKIIMDFESGLKCGVNSTPTFYINGNKYLSALDYENLHHACIYALQEKDFA